MGCGKSTVAPHLARLLGFRAVDIDARVEARTGKSVPEIFASEGETAFREIERVVLRETAAMEKVVVSLGGGTLAFGGNDLLVRSAGVLVYLRVDFGTLLGRVREKGDRPLLLGRTGGTLGEDELRSAMERLFAEREPFYRRADVVIDAGDRGPERLAEVIARAVGGDPSRFTM